MVGRSLTVHPAANGDPVETLGRKRRRGKELATLPQKADGSGQVSSLTGTPQRTDRIWDLPLPLPLVLLEGTVVYVHHQVYHLLQMHVSL